MRLSQNKIYYLTSLISIPLRSLAQTNIRNDDTIQQDVVESVEGSEMIEYLKDVSAQQVSVQCGQNKMCITIEKAFLAEKEITTYFDKLELRNVTDKCSETYINSNTDENWEDATHVELCTTDGFLSCGTKMEMNDTHVSYINQIITRNEQNQEPGQLMSPIIREYVIPWHCIYPLEYVVNLENGYYIPEISPVEYITIQSPLLQKENTYPVFMQLFETENYRTPFTEAPVLSNTDKLFVEVKMVGPDNAKIQLVNCWATPFGGLSQQELADYRFDIVKDYCVTDQASDSIAARITKNGESHSSQYEANVFKYSKEINTDKVYLHCNVKVCFDDNSKCDLTNGFCPSANGNGRRKRRSLLDSAELALDPSITTVHAGPFTLLSDDAYMVEGIVSEQKVLEMDRFEIIEKEQSNNKMLFGLPIMFIYCFVAIIVIIIALIFGIIFLVLRRKESNKKVRNEIKTMQIVDATQAGGKGGSTFVVTSNNGKTVLNTKSGAAGKSGKVSTIPTLIATHRNMNIHNNNTQQYKVRPPPNAICSSAASDYSKSSTHHTIMEHSHAATAYLPDKSERTNSLTSSKHITFQHNLAFSHDGSTDDTSVPGTSRTPSHVSDKSDRPIVAKYKEDNYPNYNNLISQYGNASPSERRSERSSRHDRDLS